MVGILGLYMGYIGDAFGLYWGYGYSPKETWNLAYSRLEGTVVSVEPLIRFHVCIFLARCGRQSRIPQISGAFESA